MELAAGSGRRLPVSDLLTLGMDVVVPVALYYLLRAAGASPVLAMIIAIVPTGVYLAARAIKRRKIDALGIFVLVLLVVGVLVSLISGSPRFLLAKSGWVTAVIGIAFFVTLLLARPMAFTLARAMLRRSPLGRTLDTDSWDDRWRRDPSFRRPWRVSTIMWGTGLLADALVRVVMAYSLPVDTVPALSAGLWAVTFVALQVAQHIYFKRSGLFRMLRDRPAETPQEQQIDTQPEQRIDNGARGTGSRGNP